MTPIDKGALSFVLHPLEQPIHRGAMHQDGAVSPRERGFCSLLNLSDDLTLGSLKLLWGHGGPHCWASSCFFALMCFFSVYHPLSLLSRSAEPLDYRETLVICRPVAMSHTLAVLSLLAVAR